MQSFDQRILDDLLPDSRGGSGTSDTNSGGTPGISESIMHSSTFNANNAATAMINGGGGTGVGNSGITGGSLSLFASGESDGAISTDCDSARVESGMESGSGRGFSNSSRLNSSSAFQLLNPFAGRLKAVTSSFLPTQSNNSTGYSSNNSNSNNNNNNNSNSNANHTNADSNNGSRRNVFFNTNNSSHHNSGENSPARKIREDQQMNMTDNDGVPGAGAAGFTTTAASYLGGSAFNSRFNSRAASRRNSRTSNLMDSVLNNNNNNNNNNNINNPPLQPLHTQTQSQIIPQSPLQKPRTLSITSVTSEIGIVPTVANGILMAAAAAFSGPSSLGMKFNSFQVSPEIGTTTLDNDQITSEIMAAAGQFQSSSGQQEVRGQVGNSTSTSTSRMPYRPRVEALSLFFTGGGSGGSASGASASVGGSGNGGRTTPVPSNTTATGNGNGSGNNGVGNGVLSSRLFSAGAGAASAVVSARIAAGSGGNGSGGSGSGLAGGTIGGESQHHSGGNSGGHPSHHNRNNHHNNHSQNHTLAHRHHSNNNNSLSVDDLSEKNGMQRVLVVDDSLPSLKIVCNALRRNR
jgi:hypothetical protein